MTIEVLPGWELVRIGKPVVNVDWVIGSGGLPELFSWATDSHNWPIIRKIEKPKQYRPFANAAEFLAHPLNGDFLDAGHGFYEKVTKCNDNGIYFITDLLEKYDEAFCDYKFRDGTPFGIEVAE